MYLASSSAAGVRFLASVRDGHGLKPSARHAGIDKEVGYRWLREKYLQLRREGSTPAETTVKLGFWLGKPTSEGSPTAITSGSASPRRPASGSRSIAVTVRIWRLTPPG
jgi:hypothetical protein